MLDLERPYDHRRWRKRAKAQLQAEPLCRMCAVEGRVMAAQVADHIKPHRGDYQLFWFGELQSLCEACHNRTKRQLELIGFTKDVGLDGLPLDPVHPFNKFRGGGA